MRPETARAAAAAHAPDPAGAALRESLAKHYAELTARIAAGEDGLALGRRNAARLDALIGTLYGSARAKLGERVAGIGVAAVGSQGRGAVALRSDADVRILVTPRAHAKDAEAFVEALLYPMWDAGVSIGHQVIEEDEVLALAQEDLATATALLDMRHLAGDPARVESLLTRAWSGLFAAEGLGALVLRLEEETAGRHERFGGSLYLLEPDVKSGPGGLRDLDGARWVSRARFNVVDGASAGAQGVWGELVKLGALMPREAQEIADAEEFLWRVRNRLHAHAGRRSDRLTFDEQETIAVDLGYALRPSRQPARERLSSPLAVEDPRALAAEALMQDYYQNARVVARARERIFERASVPKKRGRPVEVDLRRGMKLFDGQVTLAGNAELAADPALALRVYAACVSQGAPVHSYARGAISRAVADPAWCAALRASPEAADTFVDLVCCVAETRTRRGSIVGEMHDVGLVLAMIPEFQPVMGRVHHDTYHVYTVDVHSVAAVDCLRKLARGELALEHPMASRLAAEIARPKPLFLATLLHDVGKGYPDKEGSRKNHSQSGAELCALILPRLGLAPDDVTEACALVAQHLAMYHVATRRDLDDPSTVEEFCRPVRGREWLRDLYLLTVADISTTSPTAMSSWKARMLEELYIAADAHLAQARGGRADDARVPAAKEAALALWTGKAKTHGGTSAGPSRGPPAKLEEFFTSMPERYLLANAPEAIVAHAMVAKDRGAKPVHAALVPSRHSDVAELCVVAEDRPGLLAGIAAAITAGRLEVLAAQVYSRALGAKGGVEAVDLFWVRDRNDGAQGVGRAMARLVRDLEDVCSAKIDPAELLRARTGSTSPWRERPSPAVPTEVVIDDRASPRHTVVEVFAKDRPGLLYALARAFHDLGLSIALSKINTEGTKIADVFYVNERDGGKAAPGERFKTIRDALVKAASEK